MCFGETTSQFWTAKFSTKQNIKQLNYCRNFVQPEKVYFKL